jgi:hypothetical protein
MWDENNYTCFLQPLSTPLINKLTLCSQKNGIHTLVDVFIANPTQMDLLCQSCATRRFVASKRPQAKEKNYHNQHPIDRFLLLAIEVFGCLNKQADVFLHDCVNAMWNFKGPKSPSLFVLVTFLHQKISITLKRMQASSILSWVIVVGLATS